MRAGPSLAPRIDISNLCRLGGQVQEDSSHVHSQKMNVGVLGTGSVSAQYLPNLVASETLDLVAVADLDFAAASALAKRFGVKRVYQGEDILADDDIELIINLTPIPAHRDTNERILRAGKHVYSEKPLATETADSASLVRLAAELGLKIACAPDTILGDGFQAGRAAIERGDIGVPLTASATMLRPIPPREINRTGGIPFLNMAPYYLTALVNLFGPVRALCGTAQLYDPVERGADAVAHSNCSLVFDDDALATLTMRYGNRPVREVPLLTVLGTRGELCLPNPDTFAAAVRLRPHGATEWIDLSVRADETERGPNRRGCGAEDLALAVWEDREPVASGSIAVNVVETIHAMTTPDSEGRVSARIEADVRPSPRLLVGEVA